jgi:predicted DNA-binding transcriptional regulator AlpA
MFNANTATGRQTANTLPGPFTILRLPAIKIRSGYSRSTVYLRISQGLWTKQVSLGPRAVGWPDYECDSLTAALESVDAVSARWATAGGQQLDRKPNSADSDWQE